MEITAIPISSLQVSAWAHLRALLDFFRLMKPRVMLLAVFTALVGLVIISSSAALPARFHPSSAGRRQPAGRRRRADPRHH
jgi:heme O synthase-like polyprenyltransferase